MRILSTHGLSLKRKANIVAMKELAYFSLLLENKKQTNKDDKENKKQR